MSSELSDTEARLLLEKLNQRTRALAVLRGRLCRFSWPMLFLQMVLAGAMTGLVGLHDGGRGDLLSSIAVVVAILALLGIMDTLAARLERRIDALVELLQQEGMLRPGLPPERAPEG